ncbi:amidohydrolase family protein [uncultured Tenacibaculum sp.]|uniref:amidohydrolase family protein n=1 Tax=uncultured Tenacibaculum sp. TaxID=174713 RepID=UPI002607911B|nr:amidohydrolase family protein [uncultured Tenacibaculum sp.]
MKKIVVIVLITLGVHQLSYSQTEIPGAIKTQLIEMTIGLDRLAENNDLDSVSENIAQIVKQAPNDDLKKAALKIILDSSKSNKLKEYINKMLSGEIAIAGVKEEKPQVTVFKNVNLIDGSSTKVEKNTTIILTDGKISGIKKGSNGNYPSDATIVDLKGKYVMPGLIDAHVHLATDPNSTTYVDASKHLRKMLGKGILGVRDMGGDGRALVYYSRQALTGQILSPDIHYSSILAGSQFFGDPRIIASSLGVKMGTGPWAHEVSKDIDLTALMQRVKGIGSTGVKMYFDVDAETVKRVAIAAKKAGLKVWSHLATTPANALNTVQGGVQVLSHADMIEGVIDLNKEDISNPTEEIINKKGGAKLWKEMVKYNSILDVTLAVYEEDGVKREKLTLPQVLASAAYRAGVKIAAGSDVVQNEAGVIGAHIEYRLLNDKIGMTPFQTLNAAAIVNAEATGFEKELGKITIGKDGSFLVYENNPLVSVKSWNTPFYVVKRGVIYSGEELRNKDSAVTPLFIASGAKEITKTKTFPKEFENIFNSLDKNKDGFLVKEEVPNQYKSQFESIDTNGDKKISKEELIVVF